jgi:hypothetical protein
MIIFGNFAAITFAVLMTSTFFLPWLIIILQDGWSRRPALLILRKFDDADLNQLISAHQNIPEIIRLLSQSSADVSAARRALREKNYWAAAINAKQALKNFNEALRQLRNLGLAELSHPR